MLLPPQWGIPGQSQEGDGCSFPGRQILAINRARLDLLGIRRVEAVRRDFSMVFETNLSGLIDRLRPDSQALSEISVNGGRFQVQLRGQIPASTFSGRIFDDTSIAARPPRRQEGAPNSLLTLDT